MCLLLTITSRRWDRVTSWPHRLGCSSTRSSLVRVECRERKRRATYIHSCFTPPPLRPNAAIICLTKARMYAHIPAQPTLHVKRLCAKTTTYLKRPPPALLTHSPVAVCVQGILGVRAVRTLFQTLALVGPAACMLALAQGPETSTEASIFFTITVALGSCSSAGFGSSVQDLRSKVRKGK